MQPMAQKMKQNKMVAGAMKGPMMKKAMASGPMKQMGAKMEEKMGGGAGAVAPAAETPAAE